MFTLSCAPLTTAKRLRRPRRLGKTELRGPLNNLDDLLQRPLLRSRLTRTMVTWTMTIDLWGNRVALMAPLCFFFLELLVLRRPLYRLVPLFPHPPPWSLLSTLVQVSSTLVVRATSMQFFSALFTHRRWYPFSPLANMPVPVASFAVLPRELRVVDQSLAPRGAVTAILPLFLCRLSVLLAVLLASSPVAP